MKKLMILLTLISMIGFSTIGCGTNDQKQEAGNIAEKNSNAVEETEKQNAEETEKLNNEEREEEREETNTQADDKDEQGNAEVAEQSDDAEKVLLDFLDAVLIRDFERAEKYMLYKDLSSPLPTMEEAHNFYSNNKPLEITKVEEASEDIKMIYMNFKTQEEKVFEEPILLKKVNDAWYIAPQGVISMHRSVYTKEQVKDGEVGIYLKYVYHRFNGEDIYVVDIVNNTSEKLRLGFVNKASFIYENDAGKKYIEFDNTYEVNPYSNGDFWFTVDSKEGPVKSILLKDVMLGLQPKTSDVEVYMAEMVEE